MSSPASALDSHSDWQQSLNQSFSRLDELLQFLQLTPELLPSALQSAASFPLRVPLSYAEKMRRGDPRDPLLLQVLPQSDELHSPANFIADPVGDHAANVAPGLIHKYHGRALLVVTGACAVHCRYCFRREFPYSEHLGANALKQSIDYLQHHPDIEEIILSGGDPLVLSDRRFSNLIDRLEAISHLKRLRIHSRLPIVLPQRITKPLLNRLQQTRLDVVMVVHANHAQEIEGDVCEALMRLFNAGIPLLNQSVLLKGVNDSVEALVNLSEALFSNHVLPYYLHLLDRVKGASHYEIEPSQTSLLYDGLRQRLSGYLVPRLVREQAGQPYKTLLAPSVDLNKSIQQGYGS